MEELCCRITYGKILTLIYSTPAFESRPSWCFHPKHPMSWSNATGTSAGNALFQAFSHQCSTAKRPTTAEIDVVALALRFPCISYEGPLSGQVCS
jgi:hypothetical protein